MKFGFRVPSIKKRISARTSPKRIIRHNLGIKAPRGAGWLTNPKKAAYNRVYSRTTKGCMTLVLPILLVGLLVVFAFAAAAFGQTVEGPKAIVTAGMADLRGTPQKDGKVIQTLTEKTEVVVLKELGDWVLVQTRDFVGWFPSTFLLIEKTDLQKAGSGYFLFGDPRPSSTTTTTRTPDTPKPSTQTSPSVYIRGPRGGCYYINSIGKKTYVDRSLCS